MSVRVNRSAEQRVPPLKVASGNVNPESAWPPEVAASEDAEGAAVGVCGAAEVA